MRNNLSIQLSAAQKMLIWNKEILHQEPLHWRLSAFWITEKSVLFFMCRVPETYTIWLADVMLPGPYVLFCPRPQHCGCSITSFLPCNFIQSYNLVVSQIGRDSQEPWLLAVHGANQQSNPMSESVFQLLVDFQQIGAVTNALESFCQCLTTLWWIIFSQYLTWLSPDASPCHSLGSCHCHQRIELSPSVASLLLLWGAEGFVTLIRCSLIALCSAYIVDPKPVPSARGEAAPAQHFNCSRVQQLMNHFRRSQAQDSFWFCITDIIY